ncbi:MAG: Alkanesulfonate monooxygenase, partial [uncultured Thermomicrobiales bacterium]
GRLVVHPDARRRAVSGDERGGAGDEPRLHAAGGAGGRRPGVRRRAAADRVELRGRVAGRQVDDPGHEADEVPGRAAAGVDVADAGSADDGDLRPPQRRAADDQRRHRRRPGRDGGGRAAPRPRRPLRSDGRVPRDLAPGDGGGQGRLRGGAPPGRGGKTPDPGGAAAAPAALLRGVVAGGTAGCRQARRPLPDLGRAAGAGCREDPLRPPLGRGGGADDALRHPPPRRGPGDGAEGVGRRRVADQPPGRGDGGAGAGGLRPHGLPRAGADAPAAQRGPEEPGDQPEPVGGGRARPGRGRHGAGRRRRHGRGPDRGVPGVGDRHVHLQRLPAPGGGVPDGGAPLPEARDGARGVRARRWPGRTGFVHWGDSRQPRAAGARQGAGGGV